MSDEIFYKVSFVVSGGQYPGAIMTLEEKPAVGDHVTFSGATFAVTEVIDLTPPTENFRFLHVTCHYLDNIQDG